LDRAKEALGIKSRKDGTIWVWELPKGANGAVKGANGAVKGAKI
jgi:hypothetical protein